MTDELEKGSFEAWLFFTYSDTSTNVEDALRELWDYKEKEIKDLKGESYPPKAICINFEGK